MENSELQRVTKELHAIMRGARLPPADQVIALSTLCILVTNDHLEAANNTAGEEFLRMIRRTLHVLPESITQFIQAWQPGRAKQATTAAAELINRKYDQILKEVQQKETRRRIFTRPT